MRTFLVFAALSMAMTTAPRRCLGQTYPATDCGANSLTAPAGCSIGTAWCQVTTGTATTVVNGTTTILTDQETCEACTPNCGKPYMPQPAAQTCTIDVEVQFTNSFSHSVTGGISGGASFIAGIEASLDVTAGGSNGEIVKEGGTVSVTVNPCAWQTQGASLTVVKGRQLATAVTVQPQASFTCPGYTTTFLTTGMTVNGSVTGTYDFAVAGSGSAGAIANGLCPPDPPTP